MDSFQSNNKKPTIDTMAGDSIIAAGSQKSYEITILEAEKQKTSKRYRLKEGEELEVIPYSNESLFKPKLYPMSCIYDLGKRIYALSRKDNVILVRGKPPDTLLNEYSRRLTENYPEPEGGIPWVMLDFDDIALPNNIGSTSIAAIEHVISKLPECFHNVTYFYQFSSSAGICKPDGTPLKTGLNAHVFFWFDRAITGPQLSSYLQLHCINTQFYDKTRDKADRPRIRYGVDLSVIRSSNQPHYVTRPIIEGGVVCNLNMTERQSFVEKKSHHVVLPEIGSDVNFKASRAHQELNDRYKQECGWKQKRIITKSGSATGVSYYYHDPNSARVATGRKLEKVNVSKKTYSEDHTVKFARLFFEKESSPGSWYVSDKSPTVATRFGDSERVPLKELSTEAYNYVKDELKWFDNIEQKYLELNEQGYLPDLDSFIKSTNAILIAPTGSGKTTAFCRFVEANKDHYIIYAAQTIALTKQMEEDLKAADVRVVHYQNFRPSDDLRIPHVYVTTNESLYRIVEAMKARGLSYWFVVDEAHVALDDFLASDGKNQVFEDAITRAERTIFMTGTITELQTKKLVETLAVCKGKIRSDQFCYYEFSPIKKRPLWMADQRSFGSDIYALLRHYSQLKEVGQAIPRTILLMPTSKMKPYRLIIDKFGLSELAHIVSREESTQEEIEEARVSALPILVSSPLFALGLNFELPPIRLWTSLGALDVDTSQIVQTLNRANRTTVECEVRLYVGNPDMRPYAIPNNLAERLRIEGYYLQEASVEGVLDAHFQVDRVTYQELRLAEKDTAKSLGQLLRQDNFQNYEVVSEWEEWLTKEEGDFDEFNNCKAEARASYKADILQQVPGYKGEPIELLAHHLEKNSEKRRYSAGKGIVPKEISDEKNAIVLAVIESTNTSLAQNILPRRLLRLLGLERVFLSEQYKGDRTENWRSAAVEKTESLLRLIALLKLLREKRLDGISFARKLRTKAARESVLALADNNSDYVAWNKKLEELDKLVYQDKNKSSKSQRLEISKEIFEIGKAFLATIGVEFGKSQGSNERRRIDQNNPIIPDWDFESIEKRLKTKALSLKYEPYEKPNAAEIQQAWNLPDVSIEKCRKCIHCDTSWECAWGHPVQIPWQEDTPTTDLCEKFRRLPEELEKAKPEFV